MKSRFKITEYVIFKARQAGADKIFGIPGDFALPLFRTLVEQKTPVVTFTHEPALGYATDAYARLKGFGVAVVTYGAGSLNMVNAVSQAYAELSPILILSGGPETFLRKKNLMIHHRVRNFDTPKKIYDEITCASAVIEDPKKAAKQIDEVINAILQTKRPGYIEIPRNMNDVIINVSGPKKISVRKVKTEQKFGLLLKAKKPLVYAGLEIARWGFRSALLEFIEKWNLPFATSTSGKAVLPETHPNCVGNFMGEIGSKTARRAMEESDCIMSLGALNTDVDWGLYTSKPDPKKIISLSGEAMASLFQVKLHGVCDFPESWQSKPVLQISEGPLTTDGIVAFVNRQVREKPTMVIVDVGDLLFAASEIAAEDYLAPAYYASMGFAVPASIGAALANPARKVLAFVGDGAFQMTGTELCTAKRYKINPIVVLLNNHGYETMRFADQPRSYYDIAPWDFQKIAEGLGVPFRRATSMAELKKIIDEEWNNPEPVLVEAVMAKNAASQTLHRLGRAIKKLQRQR